MNVLFLNNNKNMSEKRIKTYGNYHVFLVLMLVQIAKRFQYV
jgi:hypothetical protein